MADVLSSFARAPTRDVQARQAALTALAAMRKGASYSGHFLKQAQEANEEYARNRNSSALARRSVAAQRAYDARMNAEVARQQAAFFLLAEDAGNKAVATKNVIARVQDAQKKQVLVERVSVFESRRNTLMQAAEAMTKALQHAPPLPPGLAAGAPARQTNEVATAAPAFSWRPKLYTERAGLFFSDDVRAMAGSLKGLGEGPTQPTDSTGFWAAVLRAVGQGAAVVGQAAQAEGQRVSQADPSAAGAYQQAGGILQTLGTALGVDLQAGARGDVTAPSTQSSSSWGDYVLPVAAGALVLGAVVLLRR